MHQHMGHITIMSMWMINTYHHTKPEPTGFLGCQEKTGTVNLNYPPGAHPLHPRGARLPKGTSRGLSWGIIVPSMGPVAIVVLLLEVTKESVLRRRRRRKRLNAIISKSVPGINPGIDN